MSTSTPLMKPFSMSFLLVFAVLTASPEVFAQDERPVYPANSETVRYADLDGLPDWRGLWFPAFGQVGGDDPVLIGR